jgi:hypothetical protein
MMRAAGDKRVNVRPRPAIFVAHQPANVHLARLIKRRIVIVGQVGMVALMNLGHPRLLVVILVVTAVVDTCRDGMVVVLAMVAMMRLVMPMVLLVMAAMVTAVMAGMTTMVTAAVMAGMVTAMMATMVTLVMATMMAAMMTLVMASMMTLVMGSMMTMVFAMVFVFEVLAMVFVVLGMVLVVRFGIETNPSHVVHTV